MSAVLEERKIKDILRQVEFYFSDSNLPRDKFLRSTVEQSEDGLVSLALICSFARMRAHLGLGTVKPEEIPEDTVLSVAEILRNSSSIKVSEDGKKIGRSTELLKPEEVIEQVDSRTVAASPFPYDVKIEDVQTFFGHKGKVNSVRLPRHIGDARAFCGTALIEFSGEDEAKSILLENLVYAGVDLELQPKNVFDAEREKIKEEVKGNPSKRDNSTGRNDFDAEGEKERDKLKGNHDGSMESYPKGLIVAFKLSSLPVEVSAKQNDSEIVKVGEEVNGEEVSKSSDTAKTAEDIETEDKHSEAVGEEEEEGKGSDHDIENEKNAASATAPSSFESDIKIDNNLPIKAGVGEEKPSEGVGEGEGKESDRGNEIKDEEENTAASASSPLKDEMKIENDLPTAGRGRTGGSANEGVVTREDLKKVFQNFGTVKFIDYSMGQESGYVRFEDPDAALKARAASVLKKEGGLVVKTTYIATLEAVTGEAEKDYWSLMRANKDKHRENWSSRGRYNNRNKRGGGRDFDGKRSRDFHAAKGRPNKAPKLADD